MIVNFTFSETSPASATTAASSNAVLSAASYLPGGVAGPLDDTETLEIVAELVGATGGTLDVYVQSQAEDGQPWYDVIHYPQLLAGAAAAIYRASITQHPESTSDSPTVVGKNTTPQLAANKIVQGKAFNRLRLLFVAGAGTSAGAAITVNVYGQRTGKVPY